MALADDKLTQYFEGIENVFPVGAQKKIYAGSLVCLDGATRLAEAASDVAAKVFAGVALEQADNSLGLASAINIRVRRRGVFLFSIAAATQADVGKAVFVVDDESVDLVGNVTNGIYAGVIAKLESATKVWVDIYPGLIQSDVATHLADGAGAHAATAISAAAGGLGIPANVQLALAELYQGLVKTVQGFIPVKLTDFRELAAGVFINAAGHGGNLCIDTTPILSMIADGDAMRIEWAAGNADQIAAQVLLPPDIDVAANMLVHMVCSKDGNVNNAVHMDGECYFGESDADCFPAAGASNLMVQAKTELLATIVPADLPAAQLDYNCTLVLMPEAHANDKVYLHAVWLEYKKKLLTS